MAAAASTSKGSKRLRRTREIEEEVKEAPADVDTKMKSAENYEEEVKEAAASSVQKKSPAKK